MTNVPFINKITNELSKRKLKSDVVANAILDIAVGNDRLDNLIANGVVVPEGLTGAEIEETLVQAHLSKDAIEKIEGLKASASEIDGKVIPIDTIALLRVRTSTPSTVWVSGYYAKGDGAFGSNIFEWDSTSTETDNGGAIIKLDSIATGRYKLKFSGDVNIDWFGAKAEVVFNNSPTIQNAANYCYANAKQLLIPPNRYYVEEELNIKCNVRGFGTKSILRPYGALLSKPVVIKTKVDYKYGKVAIEYEGTLNAVLNLDDAPDGTCLKDFKIDSGIYAPTDTLIETVPNVTGIRAGRKDNLHTNPAFNRNRIQNININGLHTAMDITGFIISLPSIIITSCKNGLIASEFNNIDGSIKMENVKKPFNIYDSAQVNLVSFMSEGGLTQLPSELDKVVSFEIGGIYLEGGTFVDSLFNIGLRTPVDASLGASHMMCADVDLLSFTNVISSQTKDKYVVNCGLVERIKLTGSVSYGTDSDISYTANTIGIDVSGVRKSSSRYAMTYRQNLKPINYIPNHIFNYVSDNIISGVYNSHVNVSIAQMTQDGNVTPLTGDYMIKVSNTNNVGTANRFNIELRNPFVRNHFKTGEVVTFGAWVYIPSQDYDVSSTTNTPYISSSFYDATNASSTFSTARRINNYDRWVFTTVTATITKPSCDIITLQIYMSGGISKSIGQYIYIDSIYLIKGVEGISKLYDGIIENNKSPFGFDNGKTMTYDTKGQSSLSGFYAHVKTGDLIYNWSTTQGAYEFLYITSNNTKLYQSTYTYKGIPAILPTTNNGVGTIWSNGGVLTLGS